MMISSFFISTSYARKGNQALASDYCKVYRDMFPGQTCLVDPGTCPKGYRADKKFTSNGPKPYSSCIPENKIKNLSKIGLRKFNKGSAELFNTKNCDFKEIKTLNKVHSLVIDHWSEIVQEAKSPKRDGEKTKPVNITSAAWKRLEKLIMGDKIMQVECKSKDWCEKQEIGGLDSPKMQHVYVCVQTYLHATLSYKNMRLAELGGVIVHELAHTAKVPRDKIKKHSCEDPWEGDKCPLDDATYQLAYATAYIVEQKLPPISSSSKKTRSTTPLIKVPPLKR